MISKPSGAGGSVVFDAEHLTRLLAALSERGYDLFAPTIREAAIVYDRLHSVEDLPRGWTDEQAAANYRLTRREDQAFFGYNVGPHSWKKLLDPPARCLWKSKREEGCFSIVPENPASPKLAFIGMRACELRGISILDRVLTGGAYTDPSYKTRRDDVFIVAVNCGKAGGTCFCASLGTGPRATSGYDLALTEILEPERHYFVVEIGSESGADVMAQVPHRQAHAQDCQNVDRIVAKTKSEMGRTLDVVGLKELLYRNFEHPRWDDVARRCLTCANCTMVCPTCFCSTVEDATDLSGQQAERWKKWDSCFTTDFSYIHGGSVRATPKSKYRQWMTHKLATWVDQFGEFGCVGCGRCITWCPVGIDITEEVRAIRETEPAGHGTR
jgi:sulfhydrogenase subunit beta (sulfur reductase)